MKLEDLGLGPWVNFRLRKFEAAKLETAITALIAREVSAAVRAATAGMVERPKPADLEASTDKWGEVRCVGCGMPWGSHDDAVCPRGAAERWHRAKGGAS